ncbi:MAG: site-specific DNA-methyltransferase [Acidimicrobiia bacterium]|nr:site-specific DNA-methyltransferase [Acidimicrobiia bacterium]
MPTLNFKGKQHIYAHHLTVPWRPLVPHPAQSIGTGGVDDNLIIHGDNLHALKALLPRYGGRVRCIYIDPPYNTGNEGWIYNDNANGPLLKQWLKDQSPVDGEDMERHDKWLCMMWPRLHLLRELLSDDGVIFVSIDDNEVHHLRMLMNEVFGEENFVGTFVWEGTGKNDARFISIGHDYLLTYAKDFERLKVTTKRWRVMKDGVDKIIKVAAELWERYEGDQQQASDALKDWYASLKKSEYAFQHRHYNWIDERGVYFPGDISWPGGGGPRYEIRHPATGKPVTTPTHGWRYPNKDKMLDLVQQGRVHFGPDESTVPNLKRYLHETPGQVLASVFYQDRRAAHKDLVRLLPDIQFQYPKDERVIRRLLEVMTTDDDIVLDSFAGSGTTAQAVLTLNRQDGGSRRFILVECEDYADSITAERVRRVVFGVPEAKSAELREGLGGSFTYCTLGDPVTILGMLNGETLPTYAALATWLLNTATGRSAGPTDLCALDDHGLIASDERRNYYLRYKPELAWLHSDDAILTETRAEEIGAICRQQNKDALVFAAGKYIHQDELSEMRITFCHLPYAIQMIEGV